MARRKRRARRNPRNSKGRFVKKSAKRNPKRRARRVKRRSVKANPVKRRRARRVRANPVKRRRTRRVRANPVKRRRRLRHNPPPAGHVKPVASPFARAAVGSRKKPRSAKQKAASKKNIKKAQKASRAMVRHASASPSRGKRKFTRRSKGLARVGGLRKRARRLRKRSLNRSVAMAQYHRASALRRLTKRSPKRAGKSALAKAMHIKTNPGLAGVITAAKTLAPQAAVGGVAMFGLAFAGKKISDMITTTGPGALRPAFATGGSMASVTKYVPAISTALATGVGYVAADKVAPKFKGAVAIGGLLGAIVQAVVAAAASGGEDSFMGKAKKALLGDYTTVGFGDYTTVGGRAYADGGLFREVGDYTTVGEGGDNGTEFAHDSLRGLDDTSEFAPGEGGVLSGGLFRGSSR